MRISEELQQHLDSGVTTLCRCWLVERRDGQRLGFTDHDGALVFDGITFEADSGLTASALQQATGLSVDNAEALGALCSVKVSEVDIAAGRYDGAAVTCWLVNWAAPAERAVMFHGAFGALERSAGAFRAELRGLTDALNEPMGRSFQKPCSAVLGDRACGLDLTTPGLRYDGAVEVVIDASSLRFTALPGFEEGWFTRSALQVLDGGAAGLRAPVKRDQTGPEGRLITLWEPLPILPAPGDTLRLVAGCDKRFSTCRLKFNNALNFQGFPDIPGDDWITLDPSASTARDGGSRR